MAITSYDYDKDTLEEAKLVAEILDSSISNVSSEFWYTENSGESSPGLNLHVHFYNALSGPDKAILDAVIAAHPVTSTAEEVGGEVLFEDVGGNPGLPNVDGSQLTNVVASSLTYHFDEYTVTRTWSDDDEWKLFREFETPALPQGNYEIKWHYVWRNSKTNRDFIAEVLLDYNDPDEVSSGTNFSSHRLAATHVQEPKEQSNQCHHTMGFTMKTLNAGVHKIAIVFRPEYGDTVATIFESRISLMKVG